MRKEIDDFYGLVVQLCIKATRVEKMSKTFLMCIGPAKAIKIRIKNCVLTGNSFTKGENEKNESL